MREKRILLIGPFPPPVGGDTTLTERLFRSAHWADAGYRMSRIDTSAGGPVRMTHHRLGFGDLARGARILLVYLARLPGADAVLLWGNTRFVCTMGIPIIRLAVAAGKPVIVKMFGSYMVERLRSMPRWLRPRTVAALRAATLLLPETGEVMAALGGEIGLPESSMVVLPNFLPDSFVEREPVPRPFAGRCVFLGQIKREKGVFDIVEAVRGLEGFTCDFYGQVAPRDREAFDRAIAGCDGAAFRGAIPPEQVRGIIAGYDALLLPTYHEGEGIPAVILEAFSAGTPVVTTRWKSIPELAPDGERALLVDLRSPAGIAGALGRLRSDDELRRRLVRNGFEHARSFSERRIVRDVLIARLDGLTVRRPTG